jgi:anti-sigma factor RsiW
MSTCKKIKKRLSAYLDGECSVEEKALVEAHLRSCELCEKEHDELRAMWRSLEDWSAPAPPHDLAARFWMRARDQSLRKQYLSPAALKRLLTGWATAACALAIGLLVGIYLGSMLAKPAVTESTTSISTAENVREVAYLGDIPSESFAKAYITLVSGETNGENGRL